MAWDWLKRKFGGRPSAAETDSPATSAVRWLEPGENPWGVPVLDVRPVTLGMISASMDPLCATNAVSFSAEDGRGFINVDPPVTRQIPVRLTYRIEGTLADGALFLPEAMEQKWALFFHGGRIICVRSWTRQVMAVADTRTAGDVLELTTLRGRLISETEDAAFEERVLDFLIRTHALGMVHPAPMPSEVLDPGQAAIWCMSCFGNRALFATPHPVTAAMPEAPLRTDSMLHIAVARGDASEVGRWLAGGVSISLLARDGLAPLHWALARPDAEMISLLLDRGSPADVRSLEGATPLMNAAQARRIDAVTLLLDRGADPNAADARGFTALHRAAEMGEREIVRLLLARGASANVEAQGQTPKSLALARGETVIVEMLGGR